MSCNKTEIYKNAVYLTLIHLDSKIANFKGSTFHLLNGRICKTKILYHTDKHIFFKYKTLFKDVNYYLDDINYYIFAKPKHRKAQLISEFEFFIIETTVIKYLISAYVKLYVRNVKGTISSYYKFDYDVLKNYGKVLRLY